MDETIQMIRFSELNKTQVKELQSRLIAVEVSEHIIVIEIAE